MVSIPTPAYATPNLTNYSHQTFTSLLTNPSTSPSTSSFPHSFSSPSPSSLHIRTHQRLHRTRQNLSRHRHDLLVALRVVNRIESEVLHAEFESWIMDEMVMCERVWELLGQAGEEKKDARERIERYCRDCEGVVQGMGLGRGMRGSSI
jgi:hypothetical protein